ncbi:hypothetical protein KSS87_004230 [Heliosperma pusillum]|nr:hypothetical protein KSS87_004230 [Heliosperma pusillum]
MRAPRISPSCFNQDRLAGLGVSWPVAVVTVGAGAGLEPSRKPRRLMPKSMFVSWNRQKDGDIIDCIDIYKQPAFDNPLLKNHKLQMSPSSLPMSAEPVSTKKTRSTVGLEDEDELCPDGTADGLHKTGCYNGLCPGYVQIRRKRIMGGVNYPVSVPGKSVTAMVFSIFKDPKTGNWWLFEDLTIGKFIPVGYWPKELFSSMKSIANVVQIGGKVYSPPSSHKLPPMGSGSLSPVISIELVMLLISGLLS